MIYFIRAGIDGPVKIGWSANVPSRLSTLQIGQPFKMNLLRVLDLDRWVERWLHDAFEDLRLEGEWFRYSEEMLRIEAPPVNPRWQLTDADSMDEPNSERIITPMPKSLVNAIDDYRFGERSPSRAEAIRRLLELGLEAAKTNPKAKAAR